MPKAPFLKLSKKFNNKLSYLKKYKNVHVSPTMSPNDLARTEFL